MKLVVAKVASTLILWWRASLLASPTVVPASTVPWRWTAPVRARIASNNVVLPLWNGPTSAIHRGPKFLVPLGLVPFCPIIASLAGREVGPGFPALSHYRLRWDRDWQGWNFVGRQKSLLDETRIEHVARGDIFVDQALCLVPGNLTLDVCGIEPRLRLDEIGARLDRSRAAVAAIRINIACDRRCRLMRFGVGRSLGVAILAQQRVRVGGGATAIRTHKFFDNGAPGRDHLCGNEQSAQLLLIQFGIPADELRLICYQKLARISRRHDRRIDRACPDRTRNGIERLHRPDGNAAEVDVLDAGNLFKLIVRG